MEGPDPLNPGSTFECPAGWTLASSGMGGDVAVCPSMSSLEQLEAVARRRARARARRRRPRADRRRARASSRRRCAPGAPSTASTPASGTSSRSRSPAADAAQLQLNLLRSHAVGSGPPLPRGRSCAGWCCCSPASLRRGRSGVRVELVELLLALLERGVTPVVPSRARSAPRATSRRSRTSRSCWSARARRRTTASGCRAARRCARAGLEPVALARQGGARADQRHAPDGRRRRARGRATAQRVLDAAVVAVALSLEAFKGSTVPFDARLHELRPPAGPARVAARAARAARGLAGRREPRGLRPRAGPVHAALRAAGARRGRRRARLRDAGALERELERGHRQPAGVPRRRRRALRRQLPRPAAVAAARPPRAGDVRARLVLRAAHVRAALAVLRRPAAVPHAAPRPVQRADDRPVRGRRAGQRVPGARPPGGRRLDPHERRAGGLQLDGRARRAEGARRRSSTPRTSWPPSSCAPARGSSSTARCAPPTRSRRRSRGCASTCRAWRRTARSRSWRAGGALRSGELCCVAALVLA